MNASEGDSGRKSDTFAPRIDNRRRQTGKAVALLLSHAEHHLPVGEVREGHLGGVILQAPPRSNIPIFASMLPNAMSPYL